ncbi:MAG: hypothetical protein JWO86_6745 [Myxococcaceae bacterium]|jgi:hypothetical protein|nr:hypothetical protein [Myxococcaceae bacterium]
MTPEEEQALVEQVAGAYRPRPREELRYHPAWHDLGEAERVRAYEIARAMRKVEAALDPDGMSTTARAVLARIEGR